MTRITPKRKQTRRTRAKKQIEMGDRPQITTLIELVTQELGDGSKGELVEEREGALTIRFISEIFAGKNSLARFDLVGYICDSVAEELPSTYALIFEAWTKMEYKKIQSDAFTRTQGYHDITKERLCIPFAYRED